MSDGTDEDLGARLALAVRGAREAQGLSVAALAERSGVSRAMIARIEQGAASPTAALLARLSGALRLTLTELVARAEQSGARLARAGEQPVWTDPTTAYRRRAVSPPAAGATQLVEVELPAGAEVAFDADTFRFIEQQLWVLAGMLRFREGDTEVLLGPGDSLALGAPQDCVYRNDGPEPCRYLVVVTRRGG